MRDEHRQWLGRIVTLLEVFEGGPSEARYKDMIGQLGALILEVEKSGYDGIELTILRLVRTILRDEAPVLFSGAGGAALAAAHAECLEQAGVLREMLRRQPGVAFSPDPAERPSAPSTIATNTYHHEGEFFWRAEEPDSRRKYQQLTRVLVLLREAGVTFLDLGRSRALNRTELTLLCNVAFKYYQSNHFLAELVCNLEALSADRPPLYARLIVTDARTRVHISFETRKVPAVVATGVSIQQITLQLQQDFGIGNIATAAGAVWTVEELMEIRAAFSRIPLWDRGALRNLVLLRRPVPVMDALDVGKTAASYNGSTHTLTVLDRCFRDLKAFVGGALDAIPFTHMTILHEVGHSLEVWFQTDKIPNADRIKTLEAEVARIRRRMAELGGLLNDKALTGTKRTEVQAEYEALARQLTPAEMMCALTITRSLHGNGCLTAFVLKVQELGLLPITRYSWGEWPSKPYEFWAECYSLFLVDPAALEYVSPPLYRWFRSGAYRVGGNAAQLVGAEPVALTDAQVAAIQGVQATLDSFCYELEKAGGVSPEFLVRLRARYAAMGPKFDELGRQLAGMQRDVIEHVVIEKAMDALADEVAARLDADAPVALTMADLAVLKAATERERAALTALLKPPQQPVAPPAKRLGAQNCVITLNPGGGGNVAMGGGNAAPGQPLQSLTDCLITLRERGFRAVRFRGCDALSKAEIAWLCNAARRIFAESGARLGMVVDAAVTGPVPGQGTVYYVRVTFSTKGILVLRLVGTQPAGAAAAQQMTEAQARQTLQTQYGITDIVGVDGAQWTAGELIQVCDAFARVPANDRPALRGRRLVRRSTANPQSPEAAVERRRRGNFQPGTNSIVFLDTVFTDNQGFVGDANDPRPRPRSHFHIVRLLAYAVLHHSGGEVLTTFTRKVTELRLRHLTDESQDAGNADMEDFFAEAYALCRNEIQVLQWFSQAFAEWMEREEYHW
ncbi:MAG: hypothetical protein HOV83_01200 [Catenulispora sp.]|nr:hypothetical protein [Catenulispora sp.]